MASPIQCFYLPTANPWLNLALEHFYLLEYPKKNDEVFLFLYENQNSIILGRSLEKEKEVYLHKPLPPVIRRLSGGGTVSHFKGNLNYGILLSLDHYADLFEIHKSYEQILGAIIDGFKNTMPLHKQGLSDLCLKQRGVFRKLSGNSQVRKRGWLLHHGTFMYSLQNLPKIKAWLRPPEKQPDYRRKRSHDDFMIRGLPTVQRTQVMHNLVNGFRGWLGREVRWSKIAKNDVLFTRQNILPLYLKD